MKKKIIKGVWNKVAKAIQKRKKQKTEHSKERGVFKEKPPQTTVNPLDKGGVAAAKKTATPQNTEAIDKAVSKAAKALSKADITPNKTKVIPKHIQAAKSKAAAKSPPPKNPTPTKYKGRGR